MSDEQLARALLGAGLLERERILQAVSSRAPGEKLAQAVLRLGLVEPGELMRLDPGAFDTVPMPSDPRVSSGPRSITGVAKAAPTVAAESAAAGEKRELSGDFWIEGGQDERGFDAAQAPIVRWVNEILKMALSMGASDLHLEPGEHGVLPRYRLDGRLQSGNRLPIEVSAPLISRLKVLGGLDITENRVPQDGRFRAHFGDNRFDFRVSSLPSLHGEKIVLRVLDQSVARADLESLGLGGRLGASLRGLLARSYGLVLVTGPTGSGKTTTLYSLLSSARDPSKNIVTVEDPIEYEMEGVTQTSIEPGVGLDFARAVRAILRQDPDIILIGEIRDEETADIAVRAALTGHLVLATLHTNNALGAVGRLVDMGVPPYLLAPSLAGVLAQRLVRRTCPSCRAEVAPGEAAREEWSRFFDLAPDAALWTGAGCQACRGSGFVGRLAVGELLEVNAPLRRAIAASREAGELRALARENEFRTLTDDARSKIEAGELAPAEAMAALAGHDE